MVDFPSFKMSKGTEEAISIEDILMDFIISVAF
jgi:hypothetical protein